MLWRQGTTKLRSDFEYLHKLCLLGQRSPQNLVPTVCWLRWNQAIYQQWGRGSVKSAPVYKLSVATAHHIASTAIILHWPQSYCIDCNSDSDIQFTFSTYTQVTDFDQFLPCDAMQAQPMSSCSVCVCLSRSWIVSKWINISSNFFHHWVAKPFWFFHTKQHDNIPMRTSLTGTLNAGGVVTNRDSEPISGFTVCC